jgi:hypothetical protein
MTSSSYVSWTFFITDREFLDIHKHDRMVSHLCSVGIELDRIVIGIYVPLHESIDRAVHETFG